uniref:GPI mannosyltransferase 2 n=1 Tax=Melanopsichium pennsylvanicum 4 TaxID=1398559 RepID=A0A077R9T7_9BASI|nr:conserved hypothetical protein [Melanopsichium pennsylvanicum 4]
MLKHRRPPRAQFEQARSSPQYGTSALHTELKLSSTTAQKKASIANHHLAQAQSWILQLSIIVRIVSIFLLVLVSQLQQAFDTSHNLLSYSLDPNLLHSLSSGGFQFLLSFVRWDTIYFVSSAAPTSQLHKGGYVWEQALAFQPGIIALLRLAGFVTPSMDGEWSPTSSMLLTTLLSNLATMLSPILLFRLGWTITRNKELSFTAAILSIFAPSAGTTLASPTPESFFSFASLMGLVTLESKTASTKGRLSWGKIVGFYPPA